MRFRVAAASLACLLRVCVADGARAQAAGAIEIETPTGPTLSTGASDLAFVAGRVQWFGPGRDALDLALVIDVSDSTDEPSAESPPPPPSLWQRLRGWLGRPVPRDPSHTLLGDELRAAAALLGELDPERTRVALVAFAGAFRTSPEDAWTEVPLTGDFDAVRAGLTRLLRRGSSGLTRPEAGVHRALVELLGTRSGGAEARAQARRALALFTDARAAYGGASPDGVPSAVEQARRAHVRLDVIAFGEEAGRASSPASRWAAVTGGRWLGGARRAELRLVLASLRYAEVEAVAVVNRTTGAAADRVALAPDGGFSCLLPLAPGANRVEVVARLADGGRLQRELEISRADGAPAAELSARLLAQRRRLLAERLHAPGSERSVALRPEAVPASPDRAADDAPIASPMMAP